MSTIDKEKEDFSHACFGFCGFFFPLLVLPHSSTGQQKPGSQLGSMAQLSCGLMAGLVKKTDNFRQIQCSFILVSTKLS